MLPAKYGTQISVDGGTFWQLHFGPEIQDLNGVVFLVKDVAVIGKTVENADYDTGTNTITLENCYDAEPHYLQNMGR